MTKIKICGITNKEDALWAVNLGVDFLGFNFYKGSPRKVSADTVNKIIESLPPFVMKVGVFVDENIKHVKHVAEKCHLDLIQLHGGESPQYCSELDLRVIKAFKIKDEESLKPISSYASVDYYLLDTYVCGVEGGTGEVFNWDLACLVKDMGKPIFLAGGINPDNVAQAVESVAPFCIDVASGVEKSPRHKDFAKMKEFVQNIRER